MYLPMIKFFFERYTSLYPLSAGIMNINNDEDMDDLSDFPMQTQEMQGTLD
jgi:hypothetical protein